LGVVDRRALSVVRFAIDEEGIPATRLAAAGLPTSSRSIHVPPMMPIAAIGASS
jgi:hypothetical protein